jgi:hypothetical protein
MQQLDDKALASAIGATGVGDFIRLIGKETKWLPIDGIPGYFQRFRRVAWTNTSEGYLKKGKYWESQIKWPNDHEEPWQSH